jgi:hypothetical protein
MSKSLLYKLFGIGKLSNQQKLFLKKEKCILCEEGIKTSVTYTDFKAPGKHFRKKKEWCITSMILTGKRFVSQRGHKNFLINIPLDDKRLKEIELTIDKIKNLIVSFEANLFHDNWEGKIKFIFNVENATIFLNEISKRQKMM